MLFFLVCIFELFFGTLLAKNLPVEVALTFDDFPMGNSLIFTKQERAKVYADTLSQLHIQAAFFCIGQQIECDDGGECIKMVKDHLLANHSFSHLHLSELTLDTFADEILKTDALLSHHPNFRKWFRFPYLDYGDRSIRGGTDRKRCAAFLFLRQNGYQHGYITINTFDWYVDGLLKKAIKKGWHIDWEQLKNAYLSLLDEWMETYQNRWSGVLRRKFVHVLLFHQNDLNAIFLREIVRMIEQKNWVLVSPEKAFDSPIPYLSYFTNTKKRIFKGVSNLSTTYVDEVLERYQVFKINVLKDDL